MPETRTVVLTDAERVDLLLDELAETIAQRDEWMATSRASGTKRAAIESHAGDRHEQIQNLRDDLAISEAANEALRTALKAAERELHDLRVAHHAAGRRTLAELQTMRRERDEALAQLDRPPRTYTLGRLVGTAIGAFLVAIPVGGVIEAVGRQVGSW